jgi:AcrR family transcriptional regulator
MALGREVIGGSVANLAEKFNRCKLVVMEGIGLRESKKARTRLAISDVATRLFAEHGFEQVTVAQIAAAADVSVKTVFNYFASKEDLFFDRADELLAGLLETIAARPAGMTIGGALHELLTENRVPFPGMGWGALRNPEGYAHIRSFVATEHASPALRARRLVIAEAWTAEVQRTIAADLGLEAADARVAAFAAMVMATMALRDRTLSAALLEGVAARTVERRVRAVMDDAFARLDRAFADLDVPGGAR